jgi:chromosome segregation ATPase
LTLMMFMKYNLGCDDRLKLGGEMMGWGQDDDSPESVLAARNAEIERLRAARDARADMNIQHGEVIDQLQAALAEAQEHERQTHERLGAILGTDTSLEDGARRLRVQLAEARALLRECRDHLHRDSVSVPCQQDQAWHNELAARLDAALKDKL